MSYYLLSKVLKGEVPSSGGDVALGATLAIVALGIIGLIVAAVM